jgi:hypothetical protein
MRRRSSALAMLLLACAAQNGELRVEGPAIAGRPLRAELSNTSVWFDLQHGPPYCAAHLERLSGETWARALEAPNVCITLLYSTRPGTTLQFKYPIDAALLSGAYRLSIETTRGPARIFGMHWGSTGSPSNIHSDTFALDNAACASIPAQVPRDLPDDARCGVAAELGRDPSLVDTFERPDIDVLKRARATWTLAALAWRPRIGAETHELLRQEDVGIRALRALAELDDLRVVPLLIDAANRVADYVRGSEEATIHGIFQHTIADCLNRLTDSAVALEHPQDPEALRRGIAVWAAHAPH